MKLPTLLALENINNLLESIMPKNNRKEYKGLSEEDQRWLQDFDDATERGYLNSERLNLNEKQKKEIKKERQLFKQDLFNKTNSFCVPNVDEFDPVSIHIGRKKTNSPRNKVGKFIKIEKPERIELSKHLDEISKEFGSQFTLIQENVLANNIGFRGDLEKLTTIIQKIYPNSRIEFNKTNQHDGPLDYYIITILQEHN